MRAHPGTTVSAGDWRAAMRRREPNTLADQIRIAVKRITFLRLLMQRANDYRAKIESAYL